MPDKNEKPGSKTPEGKPQPKTEEEDLKQIFRTLTLEEKERMEELKAQQRKSAN